MFPYRVASPGGVSIELHSNGSIRRLDAGEICINLFPGSEAEGGPANIHLRIHSEGLESVPLLGPLSPAAWSFDDRGMNGHGHWQDLRLRIRLLAAQTACAWFWHVEVENTGPHRVAFDLMHTQDLGIAHYGAVRLNEYYVSHYIDHSPLVYPRCGVAVASRQNQAMGGRHPWIVIGSLGTAVSYATDAMQFHGLATRAGRKPAALERGLPGSRLQHEHSLVCIQEQITELNPGERKSCGFFAWFEADHPSASSEADLRWIDAALAQPEAARPSWPEHCRGASPAPGLFSTAPWLETHDLTTAEALECIGGEIREQELADGKLMSYFTESGWHVALKAKELAVLRPHGHILRSGGASVPDEASLTSTSWMGGVFHSLVTQGHVSINRFLSTCHGYLGFFRSHGQRVFVETGGSWFLLGTPSAFVMRADRCTWIYQHAGGLLRVEASASAIGHELRLSLEVLIGGPVRFLVTHHCALNGDDGLRPGPAIRDTAGHTTRVRAAADSDVGRRFPHGSFLIEPDSDTLIETTGGDELLYPDNLTRGEPFICLRTAHCTRAALSIRGQLVETSPGRSEGFPQSLSKTLALTACGTGPHARAVGRLATILPWFIHNALVHYLSPRGLEQYSGGGWGTRDVCQGPLELLLALCRYEPLADLLRRVFRQQNTDGDWPQWFMFFEREHGIRPADSHGDIVYWPLLALAEYLNATGDLAILGERLPFHHPDGDAAAEHATILTHVERSLGLIHRRVIPGTVLAAYGHGDWNDSLQPARPEMRDHLCSSWTVTLNYQTFTSLAAAFRKAGLHPQAADLETRAAQILTAFQRTLILDEVIAGMVHFHPDGAVEALLHPRDRRTGLSYSLLPMIHAIINDMLTPEQARRHLSLIRKHLSGPDGARLFDRPMAYHGGLQRNFQRAETASYFGREIGIMYTHAHIRYAEALARMGEAEALFHALQQLNPIAMREVVPSAAPRQANCYYSSSDPAFADRYQASSAYDQVNLGRIPLEGGWRVYSSGPGIAIRLIIQQFLGLRHTADSWVIDPVIPPELDGLSARMTLAGQTFDVTYHTGKTGRGPVSVELNGQPLAFTRLLNPYRTGGVRVTMDIWTSHQHASNNRLAIALE